MCARELRLWINVAQGYPCAPLQINHSDTFTTLLIRQGPQSSPPHHPSLCRLAPSLFGPLIPRDRRAEVGEDMGQRNGVCWENGGYRPQVTPSFRMLLGDRARHKTPITVLAAQPPTLNKSMSYMLPIIMGYLASVLKV